MLTSFENYVIIFAGNETNAGGDPMSEFNIKTTLNKNGCISSITVDGKDVSMKTTEIHFSHVAGKVPTVTLTMIPDEVNIQAVGSVQKKKLL